jgi:CheY-like chemotaxis protein
VTKRVLIVDDDEDIRASLELALRDAGWDVATAANGRDALQLALAGRPPDVIVLDLMMPVMDGYGVLEALGKDARTAALPVLVLTAKAIPEEEARVTGAGAKRFLTKPFDPDDLAGELERLLEAG